MRYTVPVRPISEIEQQKKERFAFYPILIVSSVLMCAGSTSLFSGFLEKLLCLVSCYFSFWIASYVSDTMRKEYERTADAWHSYWADYWEEERRMRIQIDRLPEDSSDRIDLENELNRMHKHYEKYYC